jgi:Ca2+-binding RTX toxin-like protein
MALIDIKLSQSAVNTNHSIDLANAGDSGDMNSLVNTIIELDESINNNYIYYSSISQSSNSITLTYSNNAKLTLTGSLDNPNSYSGYATVTKTSMKIPGVLEASSQGSWRYSYSNYGSLSFQGINGTTTSANYKFLQEDSDLGKLALGLKGSVYQNVSTGSISGTLTEINLNATKFVTSSSIKGSFSLSGNTNTIAAGSTSVSISGTLSSYDEKYKDGSYVKVSGNLNYNGSTEIGYALLSDASNFAGDDTIKLTLPNTIYDDINIASGLGNDTITIEGGGSHLSINAGGGNDVISLKGGYHYANGGTDNDTYIINNVTDTITEDSNAGIDNVQSSISYTLANNFENLTLTGKTAINGTGNDLDNTLTGNAAANVLNGGGGNDAMIGGKGNDTYYVDATADVVSEAANAGTDAIITTLSTYSISALTNIENLNYSGSSDAILTGNALVNTLTGSSGNDALTGGLGNDILTGGSGADSFVFDTVANASKNKDTITDFVSGVDHIKFSKVIFTGLGAVVGNLTSDQFWSGAGVTKAHDLDDRIIYNSTTGALYYDADGNGKGASVQVAIIGTSMHPSVAYNDIQIVA